jgi:hypothetical protein
MLVEIATIINVTGGIMVSKGYPLIANMLWCIGNPIFIIYLVSIEEYKMCGTFMIYLCLCSYGVYNLWGTGRVKKREK